MRENAQNTTIKTPNLMQINKVFTAVNAVTKYCKGVTNLKTPTLGGSQNIKYGAESEVYRLVLKSKAPNADSTIQ